MKKELEEDITNLNKMVQEDNKIDSNELRIALLGSINGILSLQEKKFINLSEVKVLQKGEEDQKTLVEVSTVQGDLRKTLLDTAAKLIEDTMENL